MTIKFTNNATTTLASGINSSVTSLSVAAGTGALFPSLSGSDVFYVTLANLAGAVEIVKVTARSTDTFTIVRAQDNTTAVSWSAGDKVELRPIAAVMAAMLQTTDIGVSVQGYDANTVKKNVANAYTAQQYFTEATLTDAATVAWDVSAAQVCKVTLGGNRAFGAPTNQVAGAFYGLLVIQDGTGSRTGSWNSVFKFPTATAPTLTTTASAKDFFVFRSDGTNMYLMGKSMDVR